MRHLILGQKPFRAPADADIANADQPGSSSQEFLQRLSARKFQDVPGSLFEGERPGTQFAVPLGATPSVTPSARSKALIAS
jgi:hypothetical protein